jgi:outer membrane protein OmpA-like peptidoglycan-associated protein
MPQFHDARDKLRDAVAETRGTQPVLAARAVVLYDRWLELQYNRWNIEKIEEARDAFFAALTKLGEVSVAQPGTDIPTAETLAAVPAAPTRAPVETTSTILYFPFDSDRLSDSANTALAEMVKYIQGAGNVAVLINGHADRAGSDPYNLILSERRAKFVMKALESAGVSADQMKYFAFGETDPAVPTADGAREPKNRRVEIFIE